MAPETPRESDIVCLPVTSERLADLDRFSRQNGKFRYCSCMRWRLTSTQYHHSTKESRIAALDELVLQRAPVGILAYIHNDPIGWCSVGPRESFAALERFRALPRLDAAPVWSIVCFFVSSQVRRHGITLELLRAAIAYASSQGATIIEGYPVQPGPHLYTYMGAPSTFLAAGFTDVTPPGHARTVMRYFVPLHT
jgi:GNAT superfamily N-acetyltransferase